MKEIDCGFGVSITPIIEKRMGLDYSDYEIKNFNIKNGN